MRPKRKTLVVAYDPTTKESKKVSLGWLYDEYCKRQGRYAKFGFTEYCITNLWVS